jgi:hypothetical protein
VNQRLRCFQLRPSIDDEGMMHFVGGRPELYNDGVDCCDVCAKAGARADMGHTDPVDFRGAWGGGSHFHVPMHIVDGQASYLCDVCGNRWSTTWARRDELP